MINYWLNPLNWAIFGGTIKFHWPKAKPFTGKVYFTSDLRFEHENILKQRPNRKYETVHEMTEAIIKEWNEVVTKDDMVYIVGGFALTHHKPSADRLNKVMKIWKRLNGTKRLITGKHDGVAFTRILHKQGFKPLGPRKVIKVGEARILLTHSVDLTKTSAFETYEKYDYHIHGDSEVGGVMCCSWDEYNGLVTLEQLLNVAGIK